LILTLAKMAMIVVAVLSGLSFAHEKQMDTLQYLLMNQKGELHTVLNKFAAQLLPVSIFFIIVFMALLVFNAGSILEPALVASGVFALILYLIWLISLGLLISLLLNNSAAAVLSCMVVFVGIWMLGQGVQGAEWGKNWIVVISSQHHLSQMSLGVIKISSLWYFLAGTGLNLWFCKMRLSKMRGLS
ncbi:MAG: hypothetical protein L3J83_08670, partial [Proteobacteria bacterium]|nr:hypothetical protein [Pseudomonadota bacterium]